MLDAARGYTISRSSRTVDRYMIAICALFVFAMCTSYSVAAQNPNLLEHESFTEALRAVFHLTEELESRRELTGLPEADRRHLAGDATRANARLVDEWLDYMKHLKDRYPYLFSLAIRTNPFDETASQVVT